MKELRQRRASHSATEASREDITFVYLYLINEQELALESLLAANERIKQEIEKKTG
jgi:hypothetical protein